jgi:hypothetical protein
MGKQIIDATIWRRPSSTMNETFKDRKTSED